MSSEVTLIDDSQLGELQSRPPFVSYLRQLWQRRHFIVKYARSTAFSAGRGMFLGRFWLFVDPLVQVGVYALVFGVALKTGEGTDNFLGYLLLGVIYFRFMSTGIVAGSGLVQKSRPLISSFNFPRASIAFSNTLRSFFDNLMPALVAIILALISQISQPVGWTLILVIPIYFLMHIFNLGASLIVARLTAFVPDLMQIVRVFMQGMFYLSGVFYSVERFGNYPVIKTLMELNPVFQFLSAIRDSVIYRSVPSLFTWSYLFAWSFGLFFLGLLYFWQVETKYAQVK